MTKYEPEEHRDEIAQTEAEIRTLESDIVTFTDKLPYWGQYISEKILSGEILDDAVYDKAYELLLEDAGLIKNDKSREDISIICKQSAGAYKNDLKLVKISQVEGINALVPGQTIEFGENLTIIYGSNGSGKSGYIRLFNNVFITKGEKKILPNVHEDQPAEKKAVFDFHSAGDYALQYPDDCTNPEFKQFSVFDEKAVHAHLNNKNQFEFRLYISSIYFGLNTLSFPDKVENIIHVGYLVAFTYFILRVISAAFRKFVFSFIRREENSEAKEKQAGGLIAIANVIIWILGFVFLVDNLGYNVTTLIAGLGVGGIAIALAAQAVLGDLFSYFVIYFDRPFEIGDFVVVGSDNGVIEYIGIKTTRIRTLSGEELVCSNTDLTNSRLQNFKRMQKRRIVFGLGVTYQTSHQQVSEIPALVKGILTSKPKLQFDRAHFSGYGDFSLNFEFVYYVLDPDYNTYMDLQQEVYLEIFAIFEQKGIDFAYPTQTLYFENQTPKTVQVPHRNLNA